MTHTLWCVAHGVVTPAGHPLAILFANEAGGTVAAQTGGTVTLDTDASRILLPVVAEPTVQPTPGVEPPSGAPTPGTGGGLAVLGLVLCVGVVSRRRRG